MDKGHTFFIANILILLLIKMFHEKCSEKHDNYDYFILSDDCKLLCCKESYKRNN